MTEVQPETVPDEERLAMLNQNIVSGIKKMKPETSALLLDMWRDITQNSDMNEFIRQNMQTTQLHIVESQKDYWSRRAMNEKNLGELLDRVLDEDDDADFMRYNAELHRVDQETKRDHAHISNLMKASTTFAKEYRQCAMQRKSSIDISKVVLLKTLFIAAIHSHVHDEQTLRAISDDIKQACLQHLPVSSDTHLGG